MALPSPLLPPPLPPSPPPPASHGPGELTLTGCVLPIGGVKEKVLAARRSGVRTVLFPEGNRNEYEELAADLKQVGGMVGVGWGAMCVWTGEGRRVHGAAVHARSCVFMRGGWGGGWVVGGLGGRGLGQGWGGARMGWGRARFGGQGCLLRQQAMNLAAAAVRCHHQKLSPVCHPSCAPPPLASPACPPSLPPARSRMPSTPPQGLEPHFVKSYDEVYRLAFGEQEAPAAPAAAALQLPAAS